MGKILSQASVELHWTIAKLKGHQGWSQNKFERNFLIQKKVKESTKKHLTANHNHNVNKSGYQMEAYIATHDDMWGLVASNKRVLVTVRLFLL